MNDYLCILGLSMNVQAEPRDGAPMLQVKARDADEAVFIARGIFGSWSDPVFCLPAFQREEPPDRRGLLGATVIRSIVP